MKIIFFFLFFSLSLFVFSQKESRRTLKKEDKALVAIDTSKTKKAKVATIDMYRIVTLSRDTTYIDTSLSIKKEYSHNFLRKDNFGLLAFANEGQMYNTLQYGLESSASLPEMGFRAKHFNFLEFDRVKYASVATPVTELYFKTTMKGQSVDSYFAVNASKNLNFSIEYKGMRSLGNYINQLSSSGNFIFTTSYKTLNDRYFANFHFAFQDVFNGENGGIINTFDFENKNKNYSNRARFAVFLTDAQSLLEGRRLFLDHAFRINNKTEKNNFYVTHQFNYENKYFEYTQNTVSTIYNNKYINRFGNALVNSNMNDQLRYNKMYNKVGLSFENKKLGKFHFFIDDFRYNSYYFKILVFDKGIVPNALGQEINSFGGQYDYFKEKWNLKFAYTRSLTHQSLSNLDAKIEYKIDDENKLFFEYQNINKLPNANYNLFQSSYMFYNWSNNFNNEKINSIGINAVTKWFCFDSKFVSLNDYLYFADVSSINQKQQLEQIIAPKQYENTINYFSGKLTKEVAFGKFSFDNTFLYQKSIQNQSVLNVPAWVVRNSLYYSNHFFEKALFLQTGFVFNYFSSFYANGYNPVIGEFYTQKDVKIGGYPLFDFFINGEVKRTRIYLKAEHFNSKFGNTNNFYSAPNMPYRDFVIRFGLVWNFFN